MTENATVNGPPTLELDSLGRASVSRREAAKMLGVCEQTVHNWVSAGRLKQRKIGRKVFISVAEINRILNG